MGREVGYRMNGTGKNTIVDDVKAMLEFYEALGIEMLPLTLSETSIQGVQTKPAAPRSARALNAKSAAAKITAPRQKDIKPSMDSEEGKVSRLKQLRDEIGDCARCRLSGGRTNIVFGEGNPDAEIMFIGEGPGKEEDLQGLPFVGDAGTVLTKLIEKMGLRRSDVYIGNIVKCRPPMNRDPEEDEIATCRQFIEDQIGIIRPRVIFALGRIALQTLMNNPRLKITAARGNFFDYRGIPLMPTFHPAYLLRNPRDKWLTWADAQKVLEKLNPPRA